MEAWRNVANEPDPNGTPADGASKAMPKPPPKPNVAKRRESPITR